MSCLRHFACMLMLAILPGLFGTMPAAQAASRSDAASRASAAKGAPTQQFVDGIAAVVNKQVITLGQLAEKTAQVRAQMQQQRIPVPQEPVLRRQVLQQMINGALQDQEAKRVGIRVSDAQVDQATQSVAQRNRLTVDQLRAAIQADGMTWDQYRAELRTQIQDDMLRRRFVEDQIHISDSDVDAFLDTHEGQTINAVSPFAVQQQAPEPVREAPPPPPPRPTGPELVELAQILVEVPDYASADTVAEKRKKAEAILKRLKSGANFAGVAASSSDGPQALQGGDMGIRPLKDWPDLFIKAIAKTPPGGISGVLQSGRGFHILKVVRRGYARPPNAPVRKPAPAVKPPPPPPVAKPAPAVASGPVMVTQTHARHILIKTNKVTDDAKAQRILQDLRQRIEHGESFAELARRYSEDASAPQGGDLGWLNPGETVPAFERAMASLKDGQVSEPVKTPFGWHLIQVEGRRTKNMTDEFRRIQARRALMERRIGPAYEDWLDQLRGQAYIDNRLEKTKTGE